MNFQNFVRDKIISLEMNNPEFSKQNLAILSGTGVPYHQNPQFQMYMIALYYRSLGLSVIPIKTNDKRPLVKWKNYQQELPSYKTIYDWFVNRFPYQNIGLVLGPVSKVLVVDIDGKDAHDELVARVKLPKNLMKVQSGSGDVYRYHLYFQHPDCQTSAKYTPWHPKLEFRGEGGYVVLPPSIHNSGQEYKWVSPYFSLEKLPIVPPEILEALQAKSVKKAVACPLVAVENSAVASEDLTSNVNLTRKTRRFLCGLNCYSHNWNDSIFRAACDLCGNNIDKDIATKALLKGAKPQSVADKEEAIRTIESAYSKSRISGNQYHISQKYTT
ncbi:MAG: bifunctional DNA primase/polymerase [Thermoguttaceae bacterium]